MVFMLKALSRHITLYNLFVSLVARVLKRSETTRLCSHKRRFEVYNSGNKNKICSAISNAESKNADQPAQQCSSCMSVFTCAKTSFLTARIVYSFMVMFISM